MQQLNRVCMIADHDQRQIEYICIYPGCNLKRFACSKCVKIENHKHQQQDQGHVLDNKELYQILQEKLNQRQMGQGIRQGAKPQTKPLKQIIQKIQNSLKNIINMIEQMEQGMDQNYNVKQLNELLVRLRNDGFNKFDDIQLSMLMNIDKQADDIFTQLSDQSNQLTQNAIRIQEWCYSQQIDNSGLLQKIKDSKHKLITQDQVEGDYLIYSSAISNDFKYIVSGGTEKKLKICNNSDNKLIKTIQLDNQINLIKFTDDSKLLYVAKYQDLYQFDVNNDFKETFKQAIHSSGILNIICITNTIILTTSDYKTIIKTDVNLKQQLLIIKAHDDRIDGLDYNHNLNMIASSSLDKSIKLWNGNNGQLVLEKQNAHNNKCDNISQTILKLYLFGIQITKQQYITLICDKYIKIYSIKGNYIRSFNHDVKEFYMYSDIQPQTMKAIIIKGRKIIQVCKLELDLD